MSGDLADRARLAYESGDHDQAIQGFRAARSSFESAGDPGSAAEMASSLSVVLLQAGRSEEALSAVQGTPEIFFGLGDPQREALATGNLGAALEACGRLDQAETAYRSAVAQFEALDDKEAVQHTRQSLSQLQFRQNRPLEAAATLSATQTDRSLRGRLLRTLLKLPSKLLRS
jgi:tetratricopeptide (TPR) repeat protein